MRDCIVNGTGWVDIMTIALDRLPDIDPRIRIEIIQASTYTARLWFMITMLYILNIDVDVEEQDPYTHCMLELGYSYIQAVLFIKGDVYQYMYVLHARMDEYRDMICARREIQQRNT